MGSPLGINGVPWFTATSSGQGSIYKLQPIGDSSLSGVSLDDGTVLSAVDNPDQTELTAETTAGSVSLTPCASDTGAAVTVNGNPAGNGSLSGPFPLSLGQNLFTIGVTSLDGSSQTTYQLHIKRLSTDSSLKALSIDGGSPPGFAPGVFSYDLGKVPGSKDSLDINALANFSGATVSGAGTRGLNYGPNELDVSVTAEDGKTISTYKIKVYRQSDDSKLLSVKINNSEYPFGTGSTILNYGDVDKDTASFTLSAKPENVNAAIVYPSDLSLQYGANQKSIAVTSEDGTSTTTYTVKIYREKPTNNVVVKTEGSGGAAGGGTYRFGDPVSISATPAVGYRFREWKTDPESLPLTDTSTPAAVSASFQMPNATVTITAVFEIIKCTVTVQKDGSGTISGDGTYDYGTDVTITVLPGQGCRFVCLTDGRSDVSDEYKYTFAASSDVTLYAKFAPIDIPAIVSIGSSGYNGISFSWTASAGAAGYELFRSSSAWGNFTKIASVPSTSYNDTGLSTGIPYYYMVRAYCETGTVVTYGGDSPVQSAAPSLAIPIVSATPLSYNRIGVSWNAIDGAIKYEVYRSTSRESGYKLIATTTVINYTNKSVTTGLSYFYKVRAYRLVKGKKVYGNYSAYASAMATLGTPATISAAKASYNSIKVSWGSVAGATRYVIYRSTDPNGAFAPIATVSSHAYTDRKLDTGTTYYYKVMAFRLSSGYKAYGGYSTVASAKPVLVVPGKVNARRLSSVSVNISWGAVAGRTGYEIWFSSSANGSYTLLATTANTSYTVNRLTAGVTSYYKILAYRIVNGEPVDGDYSSVVAATP
jgi:fibronectin type 3 domain-containing protein